MHRLVDDLLESSAALGAGLDWKTSLQELTATLGLGVPEYAVTEEGPDPAKTFHAEAVVQGTAHGAGSGRSKKEAEQRAASTAFARLSEPVVDRDPAGGGPVAANGAGRAAAGPAGTSLPPAGVDPPG